MSNTILTGLRANGELHIGNYIGGIRPMVALQHTLGEDDSLFMFVPDLHSFTTPIDHSALASNSLETMRMFIAAGIDPDNSQTTLYRQSAIAAHAQLAWALQCFTGYGEAARMTEFKDKSSRADNQSVSAGLFTYPMLMAADILLYDANYVPLGDDQKQHMELTRTLAQRLNTQFETELFTVPHSWKDQLSFAGRNRSLRVLSLANPTKKMSKSIDDPKGTILLSDEPSIAAKKIMSAATDSEGSVSFNPEAQPGISNLLTIASELGEDSLDTILQQWESNSSYGDFKQFVAGIVSDFLTDFQAKLANVTPEQVEIALTSGEAAANRIANTKLAEVYRVLGLTAPK